MTNRQTDEQTDEIAIASTALAMPALRRAVKMETRDPVEGSLVIRRSVITAELWRPEVARRWKKIKIF